jgi:hypothetical protein
MIIRISATDDVDDGVPLSGHITQGKSALDTHRIRGWVGTKFGLHVAKSICLPLLPGIEPQQIKR